jgi:predicted nucleic-acid-binding protein
VKIIADTNLLVRLAVNDDPGQRRAAARAVEEAEIVIVGLHALCEMAWVLRAKYRSSRDQIIPAIESLCGIENVVVDKAAVNAGLDAMRSGADFADAVIAYEGRMAGGDVFVSFDEKAVDVLTNLGIKSRLLGSLQTEPGI